MSSWKIDRRRLLTGAGTAFALPLLESLVSKTAWAGGTSDPRRFVSLYMPNGTYNIQGDAVWYPPAGALTTNLPPVLSPFAAHIADFSVLMHPSCRARDQASAKATNGGGHVGACTTWLSQAVLTNFSSSQCTVPGSSFDQRVADAVGKPNLVLSCGCNSGSPDFSPFNYADYVSYKNGQPNEPHKNPVELYASMFANLVTTPGGSPPPTAAAARNHSILDSSLADIQDLQSKLGKNDKRKLDEHFASIRALELKLYGAPPSVASACTPGTAPAAALDNVDLNGNLSSTYIARAQAFFDMIVLAFKCDLVRSVSFMYDGEVAGRPNNACPSNLLYNGASLTASLHIGISHYGANSEGKSRTISRDRMYLSLFFYLLDALKQAIDPSGSTVLDNTIVMAGYNVIDGNHAGNSAGTPLVVGGGKNFMHPGRCYDMAGSDLVDLLYTFSTLLNLGWANFQGSSKLVTV